MGNIFRVSHILEYLGYYEITAKYEKRRKYLPILHGARVRVRLGIGLGLESGGLFSGGIFS